MSIATAPIYVPKPLHKRLKKQAKKEGKKLYRFCSDILEPHLEAAPNGKTAAK